MMEPTELERLMSEHSWNDFVLNDDGVRFPRNRKITNISFPADSWGYDEINQEGLGVWAEIRLQEIHSQMSEHGISKIWEVGSGNGAVCLGLAALGYEAIAVEPLYSGALYTSHQGLTSFACTFEELNLPVSSISAIGVFDVLEHIEDPTNLLKEFARVLTAHGKLVISVPAHPFLFSDHDSSIGHYRRYTMTTLRSSLDRAGFELIKYQYLFAFLVPLAWVIRVFLAKFRKPRRIVPAKQLQKQFRLAQSLSAIFRFLVWVERRLKLPFGLSIIAIAVRKTQ